jgi:hypothetical protein
VIPGEATLFEVAAKLTPNDLDNIVQWPDFDDAKHRYTMGSKVMPGVTGILGILDKPALVWWGMRVGLRAAHHLAQEGYDLSTFSADPQIPGKNDVGDWERLTKELKLTTNHVRDAAGARGNVAHAGAEEWIKRQVPFDLSTASGEAKGYYQSAAAFFIEVDAEWLASEVMVWSLKRWYAGTFDLLARVNGKLVLLDLKTSKDVYDTHWLQLCAYEGARRELKLDPVEGIGVIHLTPDGKFDPETQLPMIWGDEIDASIKEFYAIKSAYDALEARKARQKKTKKGRA